MLLDALIRRRNRVPHIYAGIAKSSFKIVSIWNSE